MKLHLSKFHYIDNLINHSSKGKSILCTHLAEMIALENDFIYKGQ